MVFLYIFPNLEFKAINNALDAYTPAYNLTITFKPYYLKYSSYTSTVSGTVYYSTDFIDTSSDVVFSTTSNPTSLGLPLKTNSKGGLRYVPIDAAHYSDSGKAAKHSITHAELIENLIDSVSGNVAGSYSVTIYWMYECSGYSGKYWCYAEIGTRRYAQSSTCTITLDSNGSYTVVPATTTNISSIVGQGGYTYRFYPVGASVTNMTVT